MNEQKPEQGKVKPIGTWSDGVESRGGPASDAGSGIDPIPGTPAAAPLIDESAEEEPRTSPETEHELDRLRRD